MGEEKDAAARSARMKDRLEALARTEAVAHLSPEEERAVLRDRAQALARPPVESAEATVRIVRIHLAERAFALDAALVRSVVRAPRVSLAPVPLPLEGLFAWQGEVIPVVSLGALLGGASAGGTGPLLIVGREAPELALRVSAVDEVTEVPQAALRPAPAAPSPLSSLLKGALEDGALYLSGRALLEDARLFF